MIFQVTKTKLIINGSRLEVGESFETEETEDLKDLVAKGFLEVVQ